MKNTDFVPLMVFHPVSDFACNPELVIDEVFADGNGPHTCRCRAVGHNANPDPITVSVKDLMDPTRWTFDLGLTLGAMQAKRYNLEQQIEKLTVVSNMVKLPVADLKRIQLYVDDAALGEHGYVEPEGRLCSDLIDKALKASVYPTSYAELGRKWREEAKADPLEGKLCIFCHGYCRGKCGASQPYIPRDMTPIGRAEKAQPLMAKARMSADPAKDPLSEISAVLWFMASLTCDHEPLCEIKQGGDAKCNCDKYVPDGDPWYARIKNSLQLVSQLQQAETRKNICSCNGCGDSLKQGETMVCAQCEEIIGLKGTRSDLQDELAAKTETVEKLEAKVKQRRVIQVRACPTKPGPEGSTIHEIYLKDHVARILVMEYESKEAMHDATWQHSLRRVQEFLKDRQTIGFLLPKGYEFSVLEMPWL